MGVDFFWGDRLQFEEVLKTYILIMRTYAQYIWHIQQSRDLLVCEF